MNYTYKNKNIQDLLSRSHELENIKLSELGFIKSKNKGLAGLLSESWFGLEPNNNPAADFEDVGLELKTTPIKKIKSGLYSAKERLVLKMIDYNDGDTPFYESSLYKKIKNILIINYEVSNFETIFRKSYLLKIVEDQLKIIEKDYTFIINKIKKGLAHTLSESDTTYLGACRKGHKEGPRSYKYSKIKAKSRAWSFKTSLMTQICRSIYNNMEMVIHDYSQNDIIKLLMHEDLKYLGMTSSEIRGKDNKSDKSRNPNAIKFIHQKHKDKILESNLSIKSLIVNNSRIQESLSFKRIDFNELLIEEWENSELYSFMSNPILLYLFDKNSNKLLEIKEIDFTDEEIETAKSAYINQQNRLLSGDYTFLKSSDHKVIHIRPKGKNKNDVIVLPNGKEITKRSWWINKEIINKKLQK